MSTAAATAPAITLYTAQTPNGVKIPIALEELGLAYKVVAVDLAANTQKEPWFLAINPNGRIPAITDATGGRERHVFESGAILQYLVDTYDVERKLSYPHGSDEYWEVLQWVYVSLSPSLSIAGGGAADSRGTASSRTQAWAPCRARHTTSSATRRRRSPTA